MSIRWDASGFSLARVAQAIDDGSQAAARAAAQRVLVEAQAKVPKETGDLAASGYVDATRGGDNAAAVVFGSVYARWIHEHLHFKHPHGGQAKFLELAMIQRRASTLKVMRDTLREALRL